MMQWIIDHREAWGMILGILINVLILAYNIYRLCRDGKVKNLACWLQLLEAARGLEVEAEGFSAYTGLEKLNYVISRLRVLAAEIGYDFDEARMREQVSADIAFTRELNAAGQQSEE